GKIPDILAEAKYNLDWMLKMQHLSGGVHHKMTPMRFCGMHVKPEADMDDQYIYEITSTATGNLAATAALASRVMRQYDGPYSDKCLAAAEKAWKYLQANERIVPEGGFKNPADTQTGNYGDGYDRDERFWAAVELFLATGKNEYHEYVLKNQSLWRPAVSSPAYWWEVNTLGMLAYAYSDIEGKDKDLNDRIIGDLINHADELTARIGENGYLYVLSGPKDYLWGSNSIALNYSINLLAAYDLAGKYGAGKVSAQKRDSYREAAAHSLHYMLGRNPFNMSYVTGLGTKSVINIHHRPSAADAVPEPYPGLLAGGPNVKRNDDKLKELPFDTKPGRCYLDELYSYASNEIAINWNAPLAYVLSYFIY
ncbi:MAG TPA: glycoside hydrolase family 9 protein, partial [Candidatus Goldiibacteriota bacterium]|nr:glycoside hydrolase family 9 protein [Candidatus Goldiibacteriota bacterium]